jgi:hypothetical protein
MLAAIKSGLKRIDFYYVLILIYVLWLFSLKNRQTGGMDDFDVFFHAGERLLNRENIYGPPHYYNLKYFYSVLFAGIMGSIQSLGINTVKWIWFAINTALFVRVFILLRIHVFKTEKSSALVFFFLLLLFGKIVLVNYTFNQISVLILWTMFEAYHLLKKGHWVWAILILCLGINIKIMPIVLAPYIIVMGKKPFQIIGLGLAALLFFLYIPALFIGFETNQFLIGEWLKTLNPVSDIHVMQTYEYGFTDLSSMVTKFLSAEPVYLEPQVNIADLSRPSLFLITNAIRAALLGSVVYLAFKAKHAVYGVDKGFVIAAGFMALIPLCFPHQREYSFMFSMPMFAVLMLMLAKLKSVGQYILFMVFIALTGNLVWVDFAGQTAVDVFKHYRLITMGMLAIFLMYIYLAAKLSSQNLPIKN